MRLLGPLLVLAVFGCSSANEFRGMERAEHQFEINQSKLLCSYMNAEAMFHNPDVRSLVIAAEDGKISKIIQLVNEGIDPNSKGTRNCTVLFWSMQNKSGFKKLLELGANPNAVFA